MQGRVNKMVGTNKLTTRERVSRMFDHKEADRIPVYDEPWGSTIERWRREGMPGGVSYIDYFGLDNIVGVGVDNSPRYPTQVLEQTEDYRIHTTAWGATLKDWKHIGGVPEFLDFKVKDRISWQEAKARMAPDPDRIPWEHLKNNYACWRNEGAWIQGHLWFGFDVTHSWTVGTERILMALIEDPDWCMDMFNHFLDVDLALMQQVLDAGYTFDSVTWPDDMGYKHNQFFSVKTYRKLLKPFHKRAVDWAHERGIKVRLHSCGDVNPFIPDLLEIGIDALNPLEVKAGIDPIHIKNSFGDRLTLHGGINAVLYTDPDALDAEMRSVIPQLKKDGGYIFSTDHSVPDSVSLEQFRHVVELAKELGSYE